MARGLDDIIQHLHLESDRGCHKLTIPGGRLRKEFEPFAHSIELPPDRVDRAFKRFALTHADQGAEAAEHELVEYIWKHASGVKRPEVPTVAKEHPHFSRKVGKNFKTSTTAENAMRAASIGLGVVLLGKAMLYDREKDDKGQLKEPLTALIDGSAGAALIAASLLTRGSRAPHL